MKNTFRCLAVFVICLAALPGRCNTPGKRTPVLTWTASTTPGASYNIYRATTANVCAGTPTPIVTGITTTTWTDLNAPSGITYFYNVSAVSPGGESACDGEVQAVVPAITTQPASNLGVTVP